MTAAPDALKASAKPLNVIVIADTDLLSDFMWGQQANFFGQAIFQPFANNGELVWNALDNLAGSNDLISIRGRASYSRPFDRVDDLRREADAQFRAKEQQLADRAHPDRGDTDQAAERTAGRRRSHTLGGQSPAKSSASRQEQLRIRKELRAVKAGLESDIKTLGMWIKVINILLVPLLFAGLALLVALVASPPPARHRHAAQRSLGMMRKRSLMLAAAAAVLLIAGLWLSLHRASEQADLGGGSVFADLTPALGEVSEIRLSKGDGSRTTLRKAARRLDRGRARVSRRFRRGCATWRWVSPA